MAVQSLGSLTVDLVANTAGFERGMTQAERALEKQRKAADRLTASIDPVAGAMQKLTAQQIKLDELWQKKFIPDGEYKRLSGILAENEKALQNTGAQIAKTNAAFTAGGLSAKQYAAALRGVPAQFTDIAVSLQAGQNPLTVFLQQGGQLKDMFGGAGEAARALGGYVVGLINPFTVAAAAAAVLALAYKQGSDEATAFQNALILSGNAAGTSAQELAGLAETVSDSVGTVGKAAAVLARLAASSRIPVSAFDDIAIAAIKFEEATGKAAEETVKDFEKIAKDPVKAIRELNDSMNFLTTSTYAQIEALQRQGDAAGATNLAEQAYAEALTTRSNKINENLGYVETAWKIVKNAAKDAWDAILDIGRESTLDAKLKDLNNQLLEIANARNLANTDGVGFLTPSDDLRREQIEKEITQLLVQQEESRKRAAAQAKQVADDRAGIAAVEALNKGLEQSESKSAQLAKRFAEIDKQVAAAAKRGVQYSDAQIQQLRKAAEAQFKETPSGGSGPTFREDAGTKMLDSLRQQNAALQLQATTNEKLGAQAQALARFEQEIADIKSKDVLTADQKSLLASEELLRAQLKRNVALEQEIAARKLATSEAEKLAAFQENQQNKTQARADANGENLAGLGMGEKARERLKEFQKIQADAQRDQDKLEQQRSSGDITAERYAAETEIINEELAKRLVNQQDYYNQVDEAQSSFFTGASEAWENWAAEAENYSAQASEFVTGTLDTLSGGLADSFMSILDGTKSVGEAFADLGKQMVASIVGALVKMAAQWIVYQGVQLLIGRTTQSQMGLQMVANAQATAFQGALAAFASTAAIPIVGPVAAPGAAAAAASFMAPLVAGVASSVLTGMAHDGIDAVPETGTWLLQKGERVTTASTSAKLDKTLDDVSKGTNMRGGNTVVNMYEDPNKAGQVVESEGDQGERQIDIFVADLLGDGRTADALSRKFGLRSQGQ